MADGFREVTDGFRVVADGFRGSCRRLSGGCRWLSRKLQMAFEEVTEDFRKLLPPMKWFGSCLRAISVNLLTK